MVVEVSLVEFWEMTQLTLNSNCYTIMKGGHWVALMMSLARSAAHIPSLPPLIEMGTLLAELMSLHMAEKSDASLWLAYEWDFRSLMDRSGFRARAHPWVPPPRTHCTGPAFLQRGSRHPLALPRGHGKKLAVELSERETR